MPATRGVRVDLAARLHQRHRALEAHLAGPEAVLALMRAAHLNLDPERIADLLLDWAAEWLQAGPCAVVVGARDEEVVLASRDLEASQTPVIMEVANWVVTNGREFATADLRRDLRVGGGCGAVVAMPLRCRGRIVGVLVVLDHDAASAEPAFSAGLLLRLDAVLEGPALALDAALALRRAEALSVTDDLTQLYNSRYLNQVLRREVKRAARSEQPLSVVFLDLDGFKTVNDQHGHQAGSRVLAEAAAIIRGSARETDVVARFGGDEFSMVLPDTGSPGAGAVAERARKRIAAHEFLAADGLTVRLTVSIGVATLPDVADSAEALLRAADLAMYRVKNSTKNGIGISRGAADAD